MSDGTRFALGIAILLGAMIGFFFAFHPGGVNLGVGNDNPVGILKWIMSEVAGNSQNAPSGNTTTSTTQGTNNAGSAPTATGA